MTNEAKNGPKGNGPGIPGPLSRLLSRALLSGDVMPLPPNLVADILGGPRVQRPTGKTMHDHCRDAMRQVGAIRAEMATAQRRDDILRIIPPLLAAGCEPERAIDIAGRALDKLSIDGKPSLRDGGNLPDLCDSMGLERGALAREVAETRAEGKVFVRADLWSGKPDQVSESAVVNDLTIGYVQEAGIYVVTDENGNKATGDTPIAAALRLLALRVEEANADQDISDTLASAISGAVEAAAELATAAEETADAAEEVAEAAEELAEASKAGDSAMEPDLNALRAELARKVEAEEAKAHADASAAGVPISS